MPLRDTSAFSVWVTRDSPPQPIQDVVLLWIAALDWHSWQYPSVHLSEFSSLPHYESRRAEVPGSDGAWVEYLVVFTKTPGQTDNVDLLYVGPDPKF